MFHTKHFKILCLGLHTACDARIFTSELTIDHVCLLTQSTRRFPLRLHFLQKYDHFAKPWPQKISAPQIFWKLSFALNQTNTLNSVFGQVSSKSDRYSLRYDHFCDQNLQISFITKFHVFSRPTVKYCSARHGFASTLSTKPISASVRSKFDAWSTHSFCCTNTHLTGPKIDHSCLPTQSTRRFPSFLNFLKKYDHFAKPWSHQISTP